MPLGELYRYCWSLDYFNNFNCTQEYIRWRLLFQTDLYILLTNNKTSNNTGIIGNLSNEWPQKIQMFPLNSICHGWPLSVIRLDLVLTSRLVPVSNSVGSHPFTAHLAESRLFMWLGYSSVWKILNGTAQIQPELFPLIGLISPMEPVGSVNWEKCHWLYMSNFPQMGKFRFWDFP